MKGKSVASCTGISPLVRNGGKDTPLLYNSREFMGVELEYEGVAGTLLGNKLSNGSDLLNVVNDHSLKHKGLEVIFSQPLCGDAIVEALDFVDKTLKSSKTEPHLKGNRCSTHIHINITDMLVSELWFFLVLCYFCEPVLVDLCHKDRRNNVFTVGMGRTLDFSNILSKIKANSLNFSTENSKYRAIGLNSLATLGSLEFRMFHGTTDMQEVLRWINLIQELKAVVMQRKLNVVDTILGTMQSSPEETLKKILPNYNTTLSDEAVSDMWQFARDMYAAQTESVMDFTPKFSPFYLQHTGEQ